MFGYIPDTPDERDFPIAAPPRLILPDMADYRDCFYPVRHQYSTSACVGFAFGQVLYGNLAAQGVILPEFLSVLFLYRKARVLAGTEKTDVGSQPRLMMKAAQEFGFCLESFWPFDPADILNGEPVLARQHAHDQKAAIQYFRASEDAGQRRVDIMSSIANKKPIMLALTLNQAFMDGPSAWEFQEGDAVVGRHMVSCFAYTPEGLLITNSWGAGWGQNGCTLVRWSTILNPSICTDVIALTAEPIPSEVSHA